MNLNEVVPGGSDGKESICQCRRHRRLEFHPWVKKSPWRREWLPTSVFLPGKSHGQRSLVGYSPWGQRDSDTTKWLTQKADVLVLVWLLENPGILIIRVSFLSHWDPGFQLRVEIMSYGPFCITYITLRTCKRYVVDVINCPSSSLSLLPVFMPFDIWLGSSSL